jgi:hypothetical protein
LQDPAVFKVELYSGFKAHGFVEVMENAFRSILSDEKVKPAHLLDALLPLSVFFKQHAVLAGIDLGSQYELMDEMLEGTNKNVTKNLNFKFFLCSSCEFVVCCTEIRSRIQASPL